MISEHLALSWEEILCCMFPTNALTSQPNHEKAADPRSAGECLI